MKKIILAGILALITSGSFAQDFEKGGSYISLGYGIDPWGHPGVGNAYGTYKKSAIGPIMAMYEYGLTDVLGIGRIGIGGGIAQSWYTQKYTYNFLSAEYQDVYRSSRTSILLRGAYHFEFDVPKMDVYAGVGFSLNIYSDTYKEWNVDNNPASPTFGQLYEQESRSVHVGRGNFHQVFAGIRYFFTPSFGVYAEAGHGIYVLNGGLVFHF